jgi:putative transposase
MWTSESRGRMAKIRKKLKRYPTDLTDEEWSVIVRLFPAPSKKGRPRKTDLWEVVNAIRYRVRTGCGWEMLPSDFPPWQTVYWWFRRFVRRLLFNTIHDIALMADRERAGHEASPSAAVIDSQSVKAPAAKAARLRRGQEDRRPQASHCRRYRWPAASGQSDDGRHLGLGRWPSDSRRHS